jgi:hypothetical protein
VVHLLGTISLISPFLAKEKHLNAADSHLGDKGKVSMSLIDLYFAHTSIAGLLSMTLYQKAWE